MSAPKKLSFTDLDQETLALERQLEILSQQGFSVDHLSDDSDSNPPVDDNAISADSAKASVAGTSSMPVIDHQQQTGAHVSKSPWGSSGSQSNSSKAADSSRKNTKVEGHASASGNSKDSQSLENGNI